MNISNKGIALIKKYEGLVLNAYRCPANVWTIGYGHTKGVKEGDQIAQEQAELFLREDLRTFEKVVERECKGISQNQFDALVSFVFNIGEGAFCRSTLLKCVKSNPEDKNIRNEFERWNKAGGMILKGLTRRRKEEADLYFSKD